MARLVTRLMIALIAGGMVVMIALRIGRVGRALPLALARMAYGNPLMIPVTIAVATAVLLAVNYDPDRPKS